MVVVSGKIRGSIDVEEHHTMQDVRTLIMDEFDDDMLPSGKFVFHVNGVRLSSKQEPRKLAWDMIQKVVSLYPKTNQNKRPWTGQDESVASKSCKIQSSSLALPPVDTERQKEYQDVRQDQNQSLHCNIPKEVLLWKKGPRKMSIPEMGVLCSPIQCHSTGQVHSQLSSMQYEEIEVYTENSSSATQVESEEAPADQTSVESESTVNDRGSDRESDNDDVDDDEAPRKVSIGMLASTVESDLSEGVSKKHPSTIPPGSQNCTAFSRSSGTEIDTERIETMRDVPGRNEDHDKESLKSSDDSSEDADFSVASKDAGQWKKQNQNIDLALMTSRDVLLQAREILDTNPHFCSQQRSTEWLTEISDALAKPAPKVIIGLLGNTGVGKSSLLNALLDEATVLPTSGSRGCTAAAVELRFNTDLCNPESKGGTTLSVYKGEVEFIELEEWRHELKILVEESSTGQNQIFEKAPNEQSKSTAAEAWEKINQVYGKGTLEELGGSFTDSAFLTLANDERIIQLLTPTQGSSKLCNSILVEEGEVQSGSAESKALLSGFHAMNESMRCLKLKWAKSFQTKINDFV